MKRRFAYRLRRSLSQRPAPAVIDPRSRFMGWAGPTAESNARDRREHGSCPQDWMIAAAVILSLNLAAWLVHAARELGAWLGGLS